MDYLATQSANGTYDNEVDRANLQKEVNSLKSEINRIADSANFNGINLLDGSMDASTKVVNSTDVITDANIIADGQLGQDPQAGVYSVDLSKVSVTASGDGENVTLSLWGTDLEVTLSKDETLSGSELAKKFAAAWNTATTGTDAGNQWKDDYGFTMSASAEGDKLVFTMSNAPTKAWSANTGTGNFTYSDKTTVTGNNGQEVSVTVEKEAVDSTKGRMYGQAKFELSTTAGAGKVVVADGRTVTIGDETYVFAIGADSKYKGMENVIDLTDKTATSTDLITSAAQRLSTAAQDNTRFKVGTTLNSGVITVTEKEGGVDYAKNNLAGVDGKGTHGITGTVDSKAANWAGLVQTGKVDPTILDKGLTLQIGDTADDYNQLKVSIGDMHTKAMGIDGINIGSQEGAKAAIETIRSAINYVSSVRGDLGATQNRLEHTQNNLSVMAENIQDAESHHPRHRRGRGNDELRQEQHPGQSAQAMLAQANQLPQGVLQLLKGLVAKYARFVSALRRKLRLAPLLLVLLHKRFAGLCRRGTGDAI